MATEEKKFSFSFTKQLKKPTIIPSNNEKSKTDHIQLIDCVESKSIKVKGGIDEVEKLPLVIPLINNKSNIEDIQTNNEVNSNSEQTKTDLSLEDIAVQELINESKNVSAKSKPLVLSISKLSQNGEITGEPESTMDDYENIPISEFGFAMLRGMGWKEDEAIGKNNKTTKLKMPVVRAKGMGLGADKLNAEKTKILESQRTKNGEQLKIVKNAYVKIISGRYSNMLGLVQGFDDDAGSVIIKLSLNGNIVSLQEFLIVPVTKSEYDKNSKVINLQKYEEYGKKGNDNSKEIKKEGKKMYKNKEESSSDSENAKQSVKYKKYSHKSYSSESDEGSNRTKKYSTEESKKHSEYDYKRDSRESHRRRDKNYSSKSHRHESRSYEKRNQNSDSEDESKDTKRNKSSTKKLDSSSHQRQEESSKIYDSKNKHRDRSRHHIDKHESSSDYDYKSSHRDRGSKNKHKKSKKSLRSRS